MTSSNNTTNNDEWVICPECGGWGEYEVEVAVIDHMNGGYLTEAKEECEMCGGAGEVLAEDLEMQIEVFLEGGDGYH